MTGRDKKALILLYNNRYVSSNQIAEILFSENEEGPIKHSGEIARRRMRTLIKQGFVHEYIPNRNEYKVYSLTEKGHHIACSLLGKQEQYKRENILNLGLMEHALEINDFYINLLNYAKTHSGEVKTFLVEKHNRRTFKHNNIVYTFQPDIFFIYGKGEKGTPYYCELDRGTESPKRFQKKIIAYEAFYLSELFKEDWNNQNIRPSVLVLCPDKNRIERLKMGFKSRLDWKFRVNNDIGGILC